MDNIYTPRGRSVSKRCELKKKRLDMSRWRVELVQESAVIEKAEHESSIKITQTKDPMDEMTSPLVTLEPEDILNEAKKTYHNWIEEEDEDSASILLKENLDIIKMLRFNYHSELEKRLIQEKKNEKLMNALKALQEKLNCVSTENMKLRQEMEMIQKKPESNLIREKMYEIKILEEQLFTAKQQTKDFNNERDNLWQEIRHLNEEKDSLIHDEQILKEMRDFEHNDRSDAYTKVKLLHKTMSTLRKKVDELEKKTSVLFDAGRVLEKENRKLRKEHEETKCRIIELNQTIYEKVNKLNDTPNGILYKLRRKSKHNLIVEEILKEIRWAFVSCL